MAKYSGVSQIDGFWCYRIKRKINGKSIDTKIKYDVDGKPFKNARSAYEARQAHIERLSEKSVEVVPEPPTVTLSDVYASYMKTEAKKKAAATLRKQDSMWTVHVEPKFGNRDINSITIVELDEYINDLYKTHSYSYVEGHLKFFYLLFGHAYRLEVIDIQRYNRTFVDRGSRLKMPIKNQEDYEDELKGAVVYTDDELRNISTAFSSEDGNLKLAFMLGLHCGLRISECFGLRWSCIDFASQTLTVNRQMQYENGEIRLTEVKTLHSVRTVYIPDVLFEELMFQQDLQNAYKKEKGNAYKDHERVYDEKAKQWIVGGDFVNRKADGTLLTTNSMKYWAKKIKTQYGIDFKYHNLRHTYATRCAMANLPLFKLMGYLGHKKVDTTKQYYIQIENQYADELAHSIINGMYDYKNRLGNLRWEE